MRKKSTHYLAGLKIISKQLAQGLDSISAVEALCETQRELLYNTGGAISKTLIKTGCLKNDSLETLLAWEDVLSDLKRGHHLAEALSMHFALLGSHERMLKKHSYSNNFTQYLKLTFGIDAIDLLDEAKQNPIANVLVSLIEAKADSIVFKTIDEYLTIECSTEGNAIDFSEIDPPELYLGGSKPVFHILQSQLASLFRLSPHIKSDIQPIIKVRVDYNFFTLSLLEDPILSKEFIALSIQWLDIDSEENHRLIDYLMYG